MNHCTFEITTRAALITAVAIVLLSPHVDAAPQAGAQAPVAAQGNSVASPAFEVAAIKVNKSGGIAPEKERVLPGGRIELSNATLKEMIAPAYGVQSNMILGGPRWIDSVRYDIVAKAPPNTAVATLLLMVRSLLEQRFKLSFHHEDREAPAYALVVGRDGPGLHKAADDIRLNCASTPRRADGSVEVPCRGCNSRPINKAGMQLIHRECHNVTMTELVRQLGLGGYGLDKPVVDLTRLTGEYDFEFDYNRAAARRTEDLTGGAPAAPDLSGPTIFDALQTIGLKLEAGKQPVPVIVIDHAEQPEEN